MGTDAAPTYSRVICSVDFTMALEPVKRSVRDPPIIPRRPKIDPPTGG